MVCRGHAVFGEKPCDGDEWRSSSLVMGLVNGLTNQQHLELGGGLKRKPPRVFEETPSLRLNLLARAICDVEDQAHRRLLELAAKRRRGFLSRHFSRQLEKLARQPTHRERFAVEPNPSASKSHLCRCEWHGPSLRLPELHLRLAASRIGHAQPVPPTPDIHSATRRNYPQPLAYRQQTARQR